MDMVPHLLETDSEIYHFTLRGKCLNTDQKKRRIWTLFMQCHFSCINNLVNAFLKHLNFNFMCRRIKP